MSLSNGYGVVIGKVERHYIDPPDNEGRWPHYHIFVKTDSGIYKCAINLKSRTETKIEYKNIKNLNERLFTNIISKPDGFYHLVSDSESGALDVIRHPGLTNSCFNWDPETGENAIELMKSCLKNVKRVFIFGEPYNVGLGLHNIHMNQGDPITSEHSIENGIWQDGGVIFEYTRPQPHFSILLTKFDEQVLHTDENGHPIP